MSKYPSLLVSDEVSPACAKNQSRERMVIFHLDIRLLGNGSAIIVQHLDHFVDIHVGIRALGKRELFLPPLQFHTDPPLVAQECLPKMSCVSIPFVLSNLIRSTKIFWSPGKFPQQCRGFGHLNQSEESTCRWPGRRCRESSLCCKTLAKKRGRATCGRRRNQSIAARGGWMSKGCV